MTLKTMSLIQIRRDGINASAGINGKSVRVIDPEAYWLEDNPEKLRYVVRKYWF